MGGVIYCTSFVLLFLTANLANVFDFSNTFRQTSHVNPDGRIPFRSGYYLDRRARQNLLCRIPNNAHTARNICNRQLIFLHSPEHQYHLSPCLSIHSAVYPDVCNHHRFRFSDARPNQIHQNRNLPPDPTARSCCRTAPQSHQYSCLRPPSEKRRGPRLWRNPLDNSTARTYLFIYSVKSKVTQLLPALAMDSNVKAASL